MKTAVSIYTILQEYYNSIDDAEVQIVEGNNNFVTNFSETQKAIFNEVVGSDALEVTDEGIKTSLTADE